MGRFEFIRTRPDFPGTGAHHGRFLGKDSHHSIQVVVCKSRVVRVEQSAKRR